MPYVRPVVWWFGFFAAGVVALTLTWLAYEEGLPEALALPHVDKTIHFGMAGSLAFFLDGVLGRRMLGRGKIAIPLAALLVLVSTGIEEFLQRYSVNRTSSFGDYAADIAGVTFGIWLSRRIGTWYSASEQ